MNPFQQTQSVQGKVLCCTCGVLIDPNPLTQCSNCIARYSNITRDLPSEMTVSWCKGCNRYHIPPTAWIQAELESPQLLGILLKKIPQLNAARKYVNLVNARFIWTEPHSRRIIVELTVQAEASAGTGIVVQANHEIMFEVCPLQCPDCQLSYTEFTSLADVQVRIWKDTRKKPFFLLEQAIIRQVKAAQARGIHTSLEGALYFEPNAEGLDFKFQHRSAANNFNHFVSSILPCCKVEDASKLLSQDYTNNDVKVQYVYIVNAAPLWKDDLVILPDDFSRKAPSKLMVVTKVSSHVHMIDPFTGKTFEMQKSEFWSNPFKPILTNSVTNKITACEKGALRLYQVMDAQAVEDDSESFNKFSKKHSVTEFELVRITHIDALDNVTYEVEESGQIMFYYTKSHLGNILKINDYVWGYSLDNVNYNIPEQFLERIVLVKKAWVETTTKKATKKALSDARSGMILNEQDNVEFEDFVQDVADDDEMLKQIDALVNDLASL